MAIKRDNTENVVTIKVMGIGAGNVKLDSEPNLRQHVIRVVLTLPTAKAGGFLLRRGSRYARGPCPLHRR